MSVDRWSSSWTRIIGRRWKGGNVAYGACRHLRHERPKESACTERGGDRAGAVVAEQSSCCSCAPPMPFYKGRSRPKWFPKPIRNTAGLVPKPITTGRKIKTELVPRVDNLIKGGVIPKPLWYDAVLAHPPTLEHKMGGPRPKRFEWREEDRLRRVWQRRNPEASMFPKVLFLDETQLPPGTQTTHPADVFVRKQLAMMRKHNLSEEEAYRRVLMQQQQKEKIADEEVEAARERKHRRESAVVGAQKFLREGFARAAAPLCRGGARLEAALPKALVCGRARRRARHGRVARPRAARARVEDGQSV